MAYLQESICVVSLFLQVLLCSGDDAVTFSLDDRIENHIFTLAKRENNYITWWDTTGKHPKLKEDYPRYKKYKVTTTADRMKFSQPRNEYITSQRIFSQKFDNHQKSPSKVYLSRKIQHKRVSSWNIENSFTSESEYFIKLSLPKNLGSYGGSYKDISTEKSASGGTTTDVEEFFIGKNLTIVPGTSLKVTWSMRDYVQELPWKAQVTSRGWVAVYYYYRYMNKFFRFHPICEIQHKDLESNCTTKSEDGGSVKFTATGRFTGIKNTEIDLKVTESDIKSYKGKRPQLNNSICN